MSHSKFDQYTLESLIRPLWLKKANKSFESPDMWNLYLWINELQLKVLNLTSGLDKNKLAGQIKDLQDNIQALTRVKMSAETAIKNLEVKIKEITVKYEEERVLRIDLEKGL